MKILTIILVFGSGFQIALAQNPPPADATTSSVLISSDYINQLVAEARTNNPSLKAADSRRAAAALNAESVRTWEDPMFTLGGSTFSPNGMDPAQPGDLADGVEQKSPIWGLPKLQRRVAEAEISTRQAELDYRSQQLRRDIIHQLIAAALAERIVEIGEQDVAWLDTTAKAIESRYQNGRAILADTLQIQNELATRADRLRTERHLADHEHFNLNRLLNRPADSPWPRLQLPPVGPAIPLSEKLLNLALTNEPVLKIMSGQINQARAAADLSRRTRLPEVSLGVDGRQYSGDGGFREGDFTLRFSLPWFNESKHRKDYERDRERQNTVEQERADQVLMVREELHHLSTDIEASRREALLYGNEISARSTQVLASRLSDWETGNGMFRDVLEARRMLLDSELMTARATAEQNQMLAELLLWTGLENIESLAPLAAEPSFLHNHEDHTHE